MKTITLIKQHSIREGFANFLVNTSKPIYFLLRRNRKQWNLTIDDLAKMPIGSLGYDTSNFLKANNLNLMPKAEFHDVYHVLFELDTTMHDETCLQFIPLGNGKWSLPYLVSTIMSGLVYPEYWGDFYQAYLKGKNANQFYHWDLEKMLYLPTVQIRTLMFGNNQAD